MHKFQEIQSLQIEFREWVSSALLLHVHCPWLCTLHTFGRNCLQQHIAQVVQLVHNKAHLLLKWRRHCYVCYVWNRVEIQHSFQVCISSTFQVCISSSSLLGPLIEFMGRRTTVCLCKTSTGPNMHQLPCISMCNTSSGLHLHYICWTWCAIQYIISMCNFFSHIDAQYS